MASFFDAAAGVAKDVICDIAQFGDNFERLVNDTLGLGGGGAGTLAGGFIGDFCNIPPPQLPSNPFEGGQCEGVLYFVRGYVTATTRIGGDPSTDTASTREWSVNVAGKVTGVVTEGSTPATNINIYVGSTQGNVFATSSTVGGGVEIVQHRAGIKSVTRVDGAYDGCGNPPPSTPDPPPGWNQRDRPFTYDPSPGTPITIPVIVAIGYFGIDVNGELNIPISFNFTLNPELNFTWNFNPGTGKGDPFKGDPNDPFKDPDKDSDPFSDPDSPPFPDPLNPPSPPTPPQNEPTAKRRLLRAVIVTAAQIPDELGQLYADNAPDVVIPNLGFVNFQIKVGRDTFYTPDVPVKNPRCFITCPWEFGAVGVVGTPRPGVQWRLTPVYTEQTYKLAFPPETPVS